MAANVASSPSPRLAQKYGHAFDPATPVHSPHHSVNSSTSSRTPLHTLSLHEYRKLQNTPTSQSATPPGKTLRRKAAASALNGLERAPSLTRPPRSDLDRFSRPLHLSHSAHQLAAYQPLPPSPPRFEQAAPIDSLLRSQSAEPRALGGSGSGYPASVGAETPHHLNQKVSYWKPIKRLPKPRPSWTPAQFPSTHSPAHLPAVTSISPIQRTSASSAENVPLSGTLTTSSTFSVSRFPRPPLVIDPSLSPPNDENAPPYLNTSFTTTAPATPPATPAVIHYRGASFDLVNPHESLLFHDIVTPSRELDSTDYLPLHSSDEPLVPSEMSGHRRALYTDFSSAYSGIRRHDGSPGAPDPIARLAPPPAVLSPNSSYYSSPENTYEPDAAVSPLSIKKKTPDSRFSLKQLTPIKQLTRTFKEKLAKSPETAEEELQELPTPQATPTIGHFDGSYPRPLSQSYPTTPVQSDLLAGQSFQVGEPEAQSESFLPMGSSQLTGQQDSSMPLTSMVPDDPSTQVGRAFDPYTPYVSNDMTSKPYYEEMASIYPSSSIYTGDGEDGHRGYPPSLHSKRISRPLDQRTYDDDVASPYNRTSTYSFSNSNQPSRRYSRPPTQELRRQSHLARDEKTDTISKFIDQYDGEGPAGAGKTAIEEEAKRPQLAQASSSFSQFDFGLRNDTSNISDEAFLGHHTEAGPGRRATITRSPGSPPNHYAPLAPPFEYDELPNIRPQHNTSEMFSGASSYGDTRHLLQLSQPAAAEATGSSTSTSNAALLSGQALEPSSSYSQSDGQSGSKTPREALDHAEQIFKQANVSSTSNVIPAIWARRSSGNLLRNKHSTVFEEAEEEKSDWETVGNNSRQERPSLDESIADYSSTEGGEEYAQGSYSMGQEDSLPALPPFQREPSPYRHPSPLPAHENPFNSSPPALNGGASMRTAHEQDSTTFSSSSPPYSSTVPYFRSRTRGYNDEPYYFMPDPAPWVRPNPSPYEFSDKETQDLLNSGPNDEILYDNMRTSRRSVLSSESNHDSLYEDPPSKDRSEPPEAPVTSPLHGGYNQFAMERENTFEKLSTLGPKANLTGTPQGTGMHEVGSSLADTSSPGVAFSSSPAPRQRPRGFTGFYANPGQTESRTVIRGSRKDMPIVVPAPDHERSPSQDTLFPNHAKLRSLSIDSLPHPGRPRSVRSMRHSSSNARRHRHGRPAVAGQTRLREMVLASDAQTVSSSQSTRFSQLMRAGESERPSTSGTSAPLHRVSNQQSLGTLKGPVVGQHSPHLLCPERALSPEDLERCNRISWYILGALCIFPPIIILFRLYGDHLVAWVSRGRYLHAPIRMKHISTHLFVLANFLFVVAIVVPVVVTQVHLPEITSA